MYQRSRQTTKLLLWNAQGLTRREKILEFKQFVLRHKFDIVALNETHWTDKTRPSKIHGCNITTKNRPVNEQNRHTGGGLAIYYKGTMEIETDIKDI